LHIIDFKYLKYAGAKDYAFTKYRFCFDIYALLFLIFYRRENLGWKRISFREDQKHWYYGSY